jgi:uncharacterized protein (DUF1697 family)
MITYIALLRGINVGGNNPLPMKELREILASLGCENVRTYIQSGNAAFASDSDRDTLTGAIRSAIEKRFGFSPKILLLSNERLVEIAASNPFSEAEQNPKFLHVWFLADNPRNPDLDKLNNTKTNSEKFSLGQGAFYLYTPDGLGRSKLAGHVEKCLGVDVTARNWRTVTKLLELATLTDSD